jgi:hypothetical protein
VNREVDVWRRAIFTVVAAVLSLTVATAEELPKNLLSADALKARFTGWSVYGETPSGNVFRVDYNKDGTLAGQTHKDSDNGKWWIKGNTLCRHWGSNWSHRDGKEEACFVVALDKKCVHFHNPNGDWYRTWTTIPYLDPADCDK